MDFSTDAHFTSRPQMVTSRIRFNCNQLVDELLDSVNNFNGRWSGFVLDRVFKFTLIITKFKL